MLLWSESPAQRTIPELGWLVGPARVGINLHQSCETKRRACSEKVGKEEVGVVE